MLNRNSPSKIRPQNAWSVICPPAALPPSRYLPVPLLVQVPDLSVRPLMHHSMNSATVCSSAWLSFASINESTSESSQDRSPKEPQYLPSFNLMIQIPCDCV